MVKIVGAVGIGLLSALIFSYELGIGPWLNHNDISHIILSYSAFIMYKGATLILNS